MVRNFDTFMDDGVIKEEWRMTVKTEKIVDSAIAVVATCVPHPSSSATSKR